MWKSIRQFCFSLKAVAIGTCTVMLLVMLFPAGAGSQAENLPAGLRDDMSGTELRTERTMLTQMTKPDPETRTRIVEAYARLPLTFEANQGQFDPQVSFLSRGHGYTLLLTCNQAVLSVPRSAHSKSRKSKKAPIGAGREIGSIDSMTIRMKMLGSNNLVKIKGAAELPGKTNYFVGDDAAAWHTGVPNYSAVRYEAIYPGVDLLFHGSDQHQLEYDFVVAPGADPGVIRLGFEGARRLTLDGEGNVVLQTSGGNVMWRAPVAYQEIDGTRRPVLSKYEITSKNAVSFQVGVYDNTEPLIIDPVLAYSTYLGGGGSEAGHGIAVDSAGSAYVIGPTSSTNFPTHNPMQGSGRSFVTKLSPDGGSFVYSTFIGSPTGISNPLGIAVDASGSAYVTGQTCASDFPTVNPAQGTNAGGCDAFAAKLSPTGDSLIYSTYLGGSAQDMARGIAVDSDGAAYLTGLTFANNFPTTPGSFQPTKPTPCCFTTSDAFVAKLSPAGNGLIYSSYLGGADLDSANSIAVDAGGNAYVTGTTFAANFPTANAFQVTKAGFQDVFVTKVSANGSNLIYSTYLGTPGADFGNGIVVDSTGSAYVTGVGGPGFPVVNPITSTGAIFVTKFSPSGTSLVYSTRHGGSGSQSRAIALDESGNVYITGITTASDFPTVNPIQGSLAGDADSFVTKISAAGDAFVYSTYLGGSASEFSSTDQGDIAVDGAGNAYVTGMTRSTNFPTANALQPANAGSLDAFVAKLGSEIPNAVPIAVTDTAVINEDNAVTIDVLSNDSDPNGDLLTFSAITQGTNGSVAINLDSTLTYTPSPNFFGIDSFTYTIDDGHGGTAIGMVNVTIDQVNDAPTAADSAAALNEDTQIEITLTASDIDSSSLNFILVNGPVNGSLSPIVDGKVIYTPDPNYSGSDCLTFMVNDGILGSNVAAVSVTVAPLPDPPVLAMIGDQIITEGALLSLTLSATDPDGEQLSFSASGLPDGATLDPATGAFSWTPNNEQAGTYSVTFSVADPTGRSASETIAITVANVVTNLGPICSAAYSGITEIWPPNHRMVPIGIFGVTDPDNDPINISIRQILQDEPTNTIGDANTWIDGGGIGSAAALIRAERSASKKVGGNGRVYEIFFEASDGRGKSCTGSVKVGVPHDQGHDHAVDDGKRYDSTVAGGPCLNCNP